MILISCTKWGFKCGVVSIFMNAYERIYVFLLFEESLLVYTVSHDVIYVLILFEESLLVYTMSHDVIYVLILFEESALVYTVSYDVIYVLLLFEERLLVYTMSYDVIVLYNGGFHHSLCGWVANFSTSPQGTVHLGRMCCFLPSRPVHDNKGTFYRYTSLWYKCSLNKIM